MFHFEVIDAYNIDYISYKMDLPIITHGKSAVPKYYFLLTFLDSEHFRM